MKAIFVIALFAVLGLATAQQYFESTAITRLSPTKDDYFFCVPLGVVPTGEYNLALQVVLEKPTSILIRFQDASNDLSLPQSIPVHTTELKVRTGSSFPLFNEELFKRTGCVSGIVRSSEPLIKVIVAFHPQEPSFTKAVPECTHPLRTNRKVVSVA